MKNFLFIALCCLNLIGCAHGADEIVKPYVEPQYGMTKSEMFDLLGKPEKIEVYRKSDLSKEEFYFYVRLYQSTKDEVPVCLINGKIVGWGQSYYEDHVTDDDTRIR